MKQRFVVSLCVLLVLLIGCQTAASAATEDGSDKFNPFQPFLANVCPKLEAAGVMTTKPNLTVGDVDYSGTVDARDALIILQYSVLPVNPYQAQPGRKGWWWLLEDYFVEYYYPEGEGVLTSRAKLGNQYICYIHYYLNSALMADTNADFAITPADALMVLQYAVGKRDGFIRQGLESMSMYYVPWPDEWVPGLMYTQLSSYSELADYNKMDPAKRTFASLDPKDAPVYSGWMAEKGLFPPRFVEYLQTREEGKIAYADWLRESGYLSE